MPFRMTWGHFSRYRSFTQSRSCIDSFLPFPFFSLTSTTEAGRNARDERQKNKTLVNFPVHDRLVTVRPRVAAVLETLNERICQRTGTADSKQMLFPIVASARCLRGAGATERGFSSFPRASRSAAPIAVASLLSHKTAL